MRAGCPRSQGEGALRRFRGTGYPQFVDRLRLRVPNPGMESLDGFGNDAFGSAPDLLDHEAAAQGYDPIGTNPARRRQTSLRHVGLHERHSMLWSGTGCHRQTDEVSIQVGSGQRQNGRRLLADRSVKGYGTRTTSPRSNIIPNGVFAVFPHRRQRARLGSHQVAPLGAFLALAEKTGEIEHLAGELVRQRSHLFVNQICNRHVGLWRIIRLRIGVCARRAKGAAERRLPGRSLRHPRSESPLVSGRPAPGLGFRCAAKCFTRRRGARGGTPRATLTALCFASPTPSFAKASEGPYASPPKLQSSVGGGGEASNDYSANASPDGNRSVPASRGSKRRSAMRARAAAMAGAKIRSRSKRGTSARSIAWASSSAGELLSGR